MLPVKCDAEICEQNPVAFDENVLRLDVPVADFDSVEIFDGIRQTSEEASEERLLVS